MVIAIPDIIKIKNEGISFIMLGCDGVWEVKSNSQMAQWISGKL
jgi:serine/threonine protein phosphatase PrpC